MFNICSLVASDDYEKKERLYVVIEIIDDQNIKAARFYVPEQVNILPMLHCTNTNYLNPDEEIAAFAIFLKHTDINKEALNGLFRLGGMQAVYKYLNNPCQILEKDI